MKKDKGLSPILPIKNLYLGVPSKTTGLKGESRFLLVFKKDTCDYIGQVRFDFGELLIEMFNSNFFSLFKKPPFEVKKRLQMIVLTKLSQTISIPDKIRSMARFQLEELLSCTEEVEGCVNLDEFFTKLNQNYFDNQVKAKIEWGKRYGKKNGRCFTYGSYEEEEQKIRINPVLLCAFVPHYVIELTIYHEMCHQFLPPKRKNGRWFTHHPEFKRKEREYQHYEEAVLWERANWTRLLRA